MNGQARLVVVPLDLSTANRAVAAWHRHHQPAVGHRFSLGAVLPDGRLVSVAIVGHPVARLTDQHSTAEVTRLASDGTPNACSILYAAAARAAAALGYERIQTFTLAAEPGTSLRAAGWDRDGESAGGLWDRANRTSATPTHLVVGKVRWSKRLNPPRPRVVVPPIVVGHEQVALFD